MLTRGSRRACQRHRAARGLTGSPCGSRPAPRRRRPRKWTSRPVPPRGGAPRLHQQWLGQRVVVDQQREDAPRHALVRPLLPGRARLVVEAQQLLVRYDQHAAPAAALRALQQLDRGAGHLLFLCHVHRDVGAHQRRLDHTEQLFRLGVASHRDDAVPHLTARAVQQAILHRAGQRLGQHGVLGARQLGDRGHQLGLALQDVPQLLRLLERLAQLQVGGGTVQEAAEAVSVSGCATSRVTSASAWCTRCEWAWPSGRGPSTKSTSRREAKQTIRLHSMSSSSLHVGRGKALMVSLSECDSHRSSGSSGQLRCSVFRSRIAPSPSARQHSTRTSGVAYVCVRRRARRRTTSESVSARSSSRRAPSALHMGTRSETPPVGKPQTSATSRLPGWESLPTAWQPARANDARHQVACRWEPADSDRGRSLARSGPLAVRRMSSATAGREACGGSTGGCCSCCWLCSKRSCAAAGTGA